MIRNCQRQVRQFQNLLSARKEHKAFFRGGPSNELNSQENMARLQFGLTDVTSLHQNRSAAKKELCFKQLVAGSKGMTMFRKATEIGETEIADKLAYREFLLIQAGLNPWHCPKQLSIMFIVKGSDASHWGGNPYPGMANFTQYTGPDGEIADFAANFTRTHGVLARVYEYSKNLTFHDDIFQFLDSSIVVGAGGGGNFPSLFQPLNSSVYTAFSDPHEVWYFESLPYVKAYWWSCCLPFRRRNPMTWGQMETDLLKIVNKTRAAMCDRCPSMT